MRCFDSRREFITGESPTSFPEENTAMSYSGFETEPTRLQAEAKEKEDMIHFSAMLLNTFADHLIDLRIVWRRFVELAQNEIAVVPDFHKQILFSDEAHFWLNGYVNKRNCRIWREANPQVYVETPLHPGKLTVWCASWAGGIFLQKR
ncbi:uncharacterized protein TNCV_1956921 [Trichonephila clavipes]|nr:uncharacterized protein TNCV_1956921 [Trichonephila clavipes]